MYLVIDIGGTYTKYGYYHQNGECFQHNKYKTIKTNLDDFYNKIVSLSQNVNAIAISMPGLIDNQTGMIHNITLLPCLLYTSGISSSINSLKADNKHTSTPLT